MIDIERILLATDFSRDAELALQVAKEMAVRFHSEVIVLHVDDGAEVAPLSREAGSRRDHARQQLDRVCETLALENVPTTSLLRPGDPAREILHVADARNVGIIILGTHGWTSASALLLGSVADRVLRHSPLPVLTVRHPERPVLVPSRALDAVQPPGSAAAARRPA